MEARKPFMDVLWSILAFGLYLHICAVLRALVWVLAKLHENAIF